MDKVKNEEQLSYTVVDIKRHNEYNIASVRSNIFITFFYNERNLTYLVSGDIHGMGNDIVCPICSSQVRKSGSVLSGNKEVIGAILCDSCRTILLCLFKENSLEAIIRLLSIENNIINHEWELKESYIH